jgi:hypothetical protein
MLSSPILKKMLKILKKRDSISECQKALDDLKKDKDSDVVNQALAD